MYRSFGSPRTRIRENSKSSLCVELPSYYLTCCVKENLNFLLRHVQMITVLDSDLCQKWIDEQKEGLHVFHVVPPFQKPMRMNFWSPSSARSMKRLIAAHWLRTTRETQEFTEKAFYSLSFRAIVSISLLRFFPRNHLRFRKQCRVGTHWNSCELQTCLRPQFAALWWRAPT